MEDERLVVADAQQLGQVRLGLARVDERIAVVAKDPEAAVEVEVDRRRLEIGGVVGLDADPAGFELGPDVAIGEDAHGRPASSAGSRSAYSESTSRLRVSRSSNDW